MYVFFFPSWAGRKGEKGLHQASWGSRERKCKRELRAREAADGWRAASTEGDSPINGKKSVLGNVGYCRFAWTQTSPVCSGSYTNTRQAIVLFIFTLFLVPYHISMSVHFCVVALFVILTIMDY